MREIKPLNSLEEAYEQGFKMGVNYVIWLNNGKIDKTVDVEFEQVEYPNGSREENRFWSGYDCGRVTALRMMKK